MPEEVAKGRGVRSTDDIPVAGVVTPARNPDTPVPPHHAEDDAQDWLAFINRLSPRGVVAVVGLSVLLSGSILLIILLVTGAFG